MDHREIVQRIIGPIGPHGSFEEDKNRETNMSNHIEVLNALVLELSKVANLRRSNYSNVSVPGVRAYQAMKDLKENLDILIEESEGR